MTHYRLTAISRPSVYDPTVLGFNGHHDPRNNPDVIVPFEFDGVNFPGGVHRDLRNVLHNLCLDLVPHIKGGLVDGQCGCFVDRDIRGSSSRSFHSFGAAADFNWGANPMGASASQVGHGRHTLPPLAAAIAARWGWQWGGTWSGRRDSMHIENHLPRERARRVRMRRRFVTVEFRTKSHKK